jgi:RimJ/RimL family protein N-acetyltransferase
VGGDRQGNRPLAGSGRAERAAELAWSDKVEVGWELHSSVWGRGLATEGGQAALRYGFEVVGLERIISAVRADNAASRRVMEKCGLAFKEEFLHEGALVAWYAIDRSAWQANQAANRQ